MCSYIFWLQERKTAWWEVEGWGSKRGAGIGQARDSKAWSSGQGDRVGSRYQRPKCRLDVSAEREKGHVCRATHRVRRHRETAGRRKLRTDLGKVIFCGHPREDV